MKSLIWTVLFAAAAQAEESPSGPIEEIVVIAHPLSAEGLSQAAVVLQGDELSRKLASNIGTTLEREPGIHSAAFGSAVGRPVIHGLGGPRVRVMEDRIDAMDLSVTSADHAVTVEPFIADRIEVLKGSSTLLYGSGAIGGVVDVHTGRIPHEVPEAPLQGGIESRFNTNTEGMTTAAKLNGGSGASAWHLDGTWKSGDDYEIPGFAESARLRALEEEEHEGEEGHEEEEEQEVRGSLPGSEFDAASYAGGASYIGDWGFVGAAVSRIEADYGLPGGHGHEHEEDEDHTDGDEEEEGTPVLDLEQTRVDFELGLKNPFGPDSLINVRLGANDYEHKELEPNGAVGTEFSNEAWEVRVEIGFEAGLWSNALGIQHTSREFSALGEEAFIPPVDTVDTGAFWVAERHFDTFSLETGARIGKVEHEPAANRDRSFDTYAVSLGTVVPLGDNVQLGVILDHSERAPVAEELYSNGPHLVTGSFEVGDTGLNNEVATGLSVTLRIDGARWSGSATGYYTKFADFIYQQATGAIIEDLPVFQYRQHDATFIGLDLGLELALLDWASGDLSTRVFFDFVNAEIDVSGDDDLPRIPPSRAGTELMVSHGPFQASVGYERNFRQDDTAPFELVSDAYDNLRAYVGVELEVGSSTLDLFLAGNNLTDDEQRNHTSFIKEFAPAPGRTIEAGLRLLF